MFGLTRWNPFDEVFNFQREVDRLFNQFWSDLPTRTAASWSPSFQVTTSEDGWQLNVPLAGIDPQHVVLEVAGNTLSVRAEEPGDKNRVRFEQTVTVPQFLDLDKISAAYQHGLLRLTVPLKESVKPRRIPIGVSDQKQLNAAA